MIKKLAILFLSLLIPTSAGAAIIGDCADGRPTTPCVIYVGPAGGGECDGGYNNGNCDYQDLQAAENANDQNINAENFSIEFWLYNLGPATPEADDVNWLGWTTSSDDTITIRGAASELVAGETGKWSTARWRFEGIGLANGYGAIHVNEEYVNMYDLQIKIVNATASEYHGISTSTTLLTGVLHGERLNIWMDQTGGDKSLASCWENAEPNMLTRIVNSSCMTTTGGDLIGFGWAFTQSRAGSVIYNTTVAGNFNNLSSRCTVNVTCHNNIAEVNGDCYNASGSGTHNNNQCNGNYTPFAGSNNVVNTTSTFVNKTAGDLHLLAGSNGIDGGADLSGDGTYAFSTDVDNETRTGSWDIGFDEAGGGGGGGGGFNTYQFFGPGGFTPFDRERL